MTAGSGRRKPRLLIATSSQLSDRILRYTEVLPVLAASLDVVIWAMSMREPEGEAYWSGVPATVHPYPDVRETPHRLSLLRRANDASWDVVNRPPSRLSMQRHRPTTPSRWTRASEQAGRALARVGAAPLLERAVEAGMERHRATGPAAEQLRVDRPDAVLAMNPFWYHDAGVAASARAAGLPVHAFLLSWDNPSTKRRLSLRYESLLAWSDECARHIRLFYEWTRHVEVTPVGAPQFDCFFDEDFAETRPEFCERNGLDPSIPIVTYALGSPNFLNELPGAVDFCRRVLDGELGRVQVLVRPHPIHHAGRGGLEAVKAMGPPVFVQRSGGNAVHSPQGDANMRDWVSTFRHSDVVVNLSSTVAVDAAIAGTPVVNLDYDPDPAAADHELIREINRDWTHFSPVARSGGVWLAPSMDDVLAGVRAYLADPTLHAEERRRMAELVAGPLDGRSGRRFADAVVARVTDDARTRV